MVKQNDITDVEVMRLVAQHLENLWNIYQTEDNFYFYNILKTVNFPEDLDPLIFIEYETQPKDTWPLIAWKHYKDVKLWWIVCTVNNIINPVAQPTPGTPLKILSSTIVRDVLTKIRGD